MKQRRLEECIDVFREEAARVNGALVGSTQLVLVEGVSTALLTDTSTSGECVSSWFYGKKRLFPTWMFTKLEVFLFLISFFPLLPD